MAAAVVSGCGLVAVLLAVAGVVWVARIARRKKVEGQRIVTLLGAAIATGLSAQGMYVFFRDTVEAPPLLRVLFFAFLEIMVLGSALRAKSSMQEKYSAGVDGIAMWALTLLSAILSATHAQGIGETLFRLSVPIAAAWAWEREMQLERRRRTGTMGINWAITPEKVLIRLGLADPTDRSATEVGAERRIIQLALAAKRARTAQEGRRKRRALAKLERATERAVEYAGLGTEPEREEQLMRTLGALCGAEELLTLTPPAPWHKRPEEAPAPVPDPDGTDSPARRAAHEAVELPAPRHEAPEGEAARRELLPVGAFASVGAPCEARQEVTGEAPAPRHEAGGAPNEALHSEGADEALHSGEGDASGAADESARSAPVPLLVDAADVQALTSNPQRARAALMALGLGAEGKAVAEWLAQRGVKVDASTSSWRGAVSRARKALQEEAAQRAADEAERRVVPLHRPGAAR